MGKTFLERGKAVKYLVLGIALIFTTTFIFVFFCQAKQKRVLTERVKPGWKTQYCPVCGAGGGGNIKKEGKTEGLTNISPPPEGFDYGIVGHAQILDIKKKDFLSIPAQNLKPGSNITVSVWFKQTSDAQDGVIMHYSNWNNWILWNPDGQTQVSVRTGGGGGGITNPAPYMVDEWSHAVFTYNGDVLKLYINGNLIGTDSRPAGSILPQGSYPYINIGRYASPQSGWDGCYFDGLVDEPKIYNRPLSDAEVNSIYSSESQGTRSDITDGLVAGWTFDDGSYEDISGNNHTAQFNKTW